MTQDEIIEMAEKVGFYGHSKNFFDCTRSQIETFAKLVAAKEREACAYIAEGYPKYGESIAEEIRARGEA